MKKYKVLLVTPYCVWDDVEADNEKDAIKQCNYPDEFDLNEEHLWFVEEIEDDEEKGNSLKPEPKPFLFEP